MLRQTPDDILSPLLIFLCWMMTYWELQTRLSRNLNLIVIQLVFGYHLFVSDKLDRTKLSHYYFLTNSLTIAVLLPWHQTFWDMEGNGCGGYYAWLKMMRNFIRSQWSCLRAGAMWDRRLRLRMSQAAAFWTCWGEASVDTGRPTRTELQ